MNKVELKSPCFCKQIIIVIIQWIPPPPIFIGWEPTMWPSNNCLQIMVCSWVISSKSIFAPNNILLTRNSNHEKETNWFLPAACLPVPPKNWRQTQWSNDKTIIKLAYCKISWFVSVSQINYLPKLKAEANNWSARNWQITIFCSTSSNNNC